MKTKSIDFNKYRLLVGLVFFSCVQFACLLFASLAQRWPEIMRYWSKVETTFTQSPYETLKKGLTSRVRLSAYAIIFCSAGKLPINFVILYWFSFLFFKWNMACIYHQLYLPISAELNCVRMCITTPKKYHLRII